MTPYSAQIARVFGSSKKKKNLQIKKQNLNFFFGFRRFFFKNLRIYKIFNMKRKRKLLYNYLLTTVSPYDDDTYRYSTSTSIRRSSTASYSAMNINDIFEEPYSPPIKQRRILMHQRKKENALIKVSVILIASQIRKGHVSNRIPFDSLRLLLGFDETLQKKVYFIFYFNLYLLFIFFF